jgi:hypothetical protein
MFAATRLPTAFSALLGLLCMLVAACGGGGGDGGGGPTPPTGTTPAITVSLLNSSASVQTGSTTSTTVSVGRSGNYSGTVTLSAEGAPAGVTATLATASIPAGMTSATLDIAVSGSATPGTYTLTIRATGTGVTAVTTTFTLTVTASPVPSYQLSVAPGALTVVEGSSGTAQVTITRSGGFTSDVQLTPGTTPTDVAVSFSPNVTNGTTSQMTITVGLGVAAGVYPITITGASSGMANRTTQIVLTVTPQPTAGTVVVNPSTIQVVQGSSSAAATVTITRERGVTGAAQLSLEALPFGLTGTFSPNPVTGTSATLTIHAGPTAGTGTVTIRVRATIGDRSTVTNVIVTTTSFIPPDFGIAVNPTAVAVTAGNATSSALAITRTGAFTGGVSFVVTGAPIGVTATVTPSPATGTTATVNISTTAAVAAGVYPLVISGTGTGVTGARTTNLSLTVNAPSGGGNVLWQFCSAARVPLWLGTRSGTSGAWTQITAGANNTYSIPFSQPGQIAYVQTATNGFDVTVLGFTPSEALQTAPGECANNPPTKTVSGTVTNLLNQRAVAVVMGGAFAQTVPGFNNFTLTNVKDGVTDLIAMMGFFDNGMFTGYDRVIVRRNINPTAGSTMPVLDFAGSEFAFSAGSNSFFENTSGEAFTVTMAYVTGNGTVGTYQFGLPSTETTRTQWGVPQSQRGASDLHRMTAATSNASAPRSIIKYTANPAFGPSAFGPLLGAPNNTVVGTNPVRLRSQGTWQTEYGLAAGATFYQSVAAPNARSVTITGSRAFFGAASGYDFEIPDFTGAPGWNPDWMLKPGVLTNINVNASGLSAGASTTPADGVTMITGARTGTITP